MLFSPDEIHRGDKSFKLVAMQYNKIIKIFFNVVLGIVLLLGLAVGFTFLPFNNNFKILTVMSGSMEPKLKTGELIVVIPKTDYNVNDVISFSVKNNQDGKDKLTTITHRVIEKTTKDEQVVYTTKGDANDTPDGSQVESRHVIGKFLFGLPYLGYLIGYIKTLPGLLLIIIIPSTIIIYEEIGKIKREAKAVLEKRRAKKKDAKKTATKKPTSKKVDSEESKSKIPNKNKEVTLSNKDSAKSQPASGGKKKGKRARKTQKSN